MIADAPPPEPAPPPAPRAPAPALPPPVKESIYVTLRDTEGDIAGLPGFSIKRKPDDKRCGGIAIVTTRAKKVAKEDQPLADVFALEFPAGLSFDEKNKTKSLQKFNAFLQDMTNAGAKAREHYEHQMRNGDAVAKVVAGARMAQLFTRLASLLARAEIPNDIRTGDFAAAASEAFCDGMIEQAQLIQDMATQAIEVCAAKKPTANGGWWDAVCVSP